MNSRKTDERQLEVAKMLFLRYVADYTPWDKERSDDMRSQVGMGESDKQIHGKKRNWLEYL
jgi:hypothetical protein